MTTSSISQLPMKVCVLLFLSMLTACGEDDLVEQIDETDIESIVYPALTNAYHYSISDSSYVKVDYEYDNSCKLTEVNNTGPTSSGSTRLEYHSDGRLWRTKTVHSVYFEVVVEIEQYSTNNLPKKIVRTIPAAGFITTYNISYDADDKIVSMTAVSINPSTKEETIIDSFYEYTGDNVTRVTSTYGYEYIYEYSNEGYSIERGQVLNGKYDWSSIDFREAMSQNLLSKRTIIGQLSSVSNYSYTLDGNEFPTNVITESIYGDNFDEKYITKSDFELAYGSCR